MIGLALMLMAQAAAASAPPAPDCRYDRAAMMALDFVAFDQSTTGGWRPLAERGCGVAAAALIRDYRAVHRQNVYLLYWHEGQLRAEAGQSKFAIAAFQKSYKPAEEDGEFGWNLYVSGSIAFLRGNRSALQAARDHLAALPLPESYADQLKNPDGTPAKIRWPMNLNVLDGFLRCFGQSYHAAYGPNCNVRPAN